MIVGLLILTPSLSRLGSFGAVGVMMGGILSHLFILGIEVQGDGGLLFGLAIVVLVSSVINFVLTKEKSQILGFAL